MSKGADERSEYRLSASLPIDRLAIVTDLLAVFAVLAFAEGRTMALAAFVAVVTLMASGAYRTRLTLSVLDVLPKLGLASALTALSVGLAGSDSLRRVVLLTGAVLATLMVARAAALQVERARRAKPAGRRPTLIVGAGRHGTELAEAMLHRPDCGLEPIAFIDDLPSRRPDGSRPPLPVVGSGSELLSTLTALTEREIACAVVADPSISETDVLEVLRECDRLDSEIYVLPRLWEMTAVSGEMDRIGAFPLMRIRRAAHRTMSWHLKIRTSQALSALLLILLAPLLLIIALAVYLSDTNAPILFRQRRVGMDEREFELLKFRTLRPESAQEAAEKWNIADDHRISRLGRLLRASGLDELPQLWNVWRGDMTIVGPRPERPHFVRLFTDAIPHYRARHRVPAGLTGWAAVSGLRGDTCIADRALHDNFYIENWSVWLDVKILLRTVLELLPTRRR